MNKLVTGFASLMVLGTVVFASGAFTSAELTRSADIQVANDSNGVIAFTPGTTNAASIQNGELSIDTAQAGANGLNVSGVFEYGDTTDAVNSNLFTITPTEDRTINIDYNNVVDSQTSTDAVTFTVYDGTGTSVTTVTEATGGSFSATSGTTYYVVMEVDTNGLDDTADLTGDLVFTA